ncbi:alpha-1,2-mannosidase, putative [Lentimicrobium saccharophilum]|uniref:Alpha-1,2-mannosidase, putative n=1 Tax=Lentimicrobium saccharophilum TaxID=1678841 RepID=A0A0S7C482_9BACT|nr:GH92 family glycosyl hydrolase [Lentimicrobium saccharophilum]GAP43731.1 alpha-1,2-mannosidase, putative [Lentimicrobium saccharophilum]
MKKLSVTLITLLFAVFFSACDRQAETGEPASYVDPFIGTGGHGHTYPGATVPFGMVQLSPQTRLDGWDGCSGYHFTDSVIYGFAHTALNGTGVSDYGDILVIPVVGEPVFKNTEYSSSFSKSSEKAEAGYYSVKLDKPGVLAELTATTRAGYHRYTFPASEAANFIIDLQHRDIVLESWIEFVSDTEIRGMRRSTNWAKDMVWYFHMQFSKPIARKGIVVNDTLMADALRAEGTNIKAFAGFATTEGEQIEVKVGLSAVDSEGALKNLTAEIPEWNFDEIRKQSFDTWNKELGKIRVKGGSDEQMKVFYSALYHAMMQPNTFMDTDGRYRGMDRGIHTAEGFTNYTVFSLWDTYRTWHPLMTIIEQERTTDFIKTMLNMYEKGGLLPVWELAGNETWCMIGNHAIPVIADAWMKGIRNYDGDKAFEAMVKSASQDHHGLEFYRKYGYIPGDKEHESISKTLEYAYNDWCIAAMAKDLGRDNLYREYLRRAQSYKNIFDPSTGFMRPKLNGSWLTPFDPTTVDWHFTEANSFHYSYYVPQDISGLMALHGSKEQFAAKIDELFTTETEVGGRDMKDISGLIGQYAQGNEPSHHMAYLYNFVGQPWKTQQRVRRIMDDFYTPQPDGLIGNEDCGQMSAWLIMSAMGFYPVTPGLPEYIIGTPWFPEMEITLENGNVLKIIAKNVSEENFYIQSATLNGEKYTRSFISHDDLMKGGELVFIMGSKPSQSWGTGEGNEPVTSITEELILPVPFLIAPDARFRDVMQVSVGTIVPGCEVFYTIDGSTPDRNSARFTGPVTLSATTTFKAITYREGFGYSLPVEGNFYKIDLNRKVELLSEYHPNYHGGGPEALIDGLRGAGNWRLGGWQGYQGTDFEAIVDLGSKKPVRKVAAGFVQDVRSWIWMPVEVVFSVSDDGSNFREISRVKNTIPVTDYEMRTADLGAKVSTSARYVKVKAENFGTIPPWHLGAGGQAYIFVDEIIVE